MRVAQIPVHAVPAHRSPSRHRRDDAACGTHDEGVQVRVAHLHPFDRGASAG